VTDATARAATGTISTYHHCPRHRRQRIATATVTVREPGGNGDDELHSHGTPRYEIMSP
jgi:hypothetical protein